MSHRVYRIAFLAIVLLASTVLVGGYLTSSGADAAVRQTAANGTEVIDGRAVPPRDNVTVITTDSNVWLADEGAGPRAHSEIVAFAPNGSRFYYNDSYNRYWDVDPSPAGRTSVLYTASNHLNRSECDATTVCTRNVIEEVNLTTGEVRRHYARVTPFKHSTRWHDVDRVGDSRFLVADIYRDRVFVVNATTGIVEWEWEAQSDFDPKSGGPFPRDWTHLNDVEVLEDGRIMVSLRNQDQVVFLDRDRGLLANWTLGEDDDHATLYEQHNPDFIPERDGGPAVLVADSENNRIVEYQRADGGWERTWTWTDAKLQWPRDADRLPNGNTLVTDSNGDRVLEVDEEGDVVWSVDVAFPYEAERLGTGDESSNGPSAREADLRSGSEDVEGTPSGTDEQASASVVGVELGDFLKGPRYNAVMYVLPMWMGLVELAGLVVLFSVSLLWLLFELYWSPWSVSIRTPLRLERK